MDFNLDSLSTILEKGESVEWAAKAEPFPAVDRYNKSSILLRAVVSIIIGAVLIALYCFVMIRKATPINAAFPIIIAAVVVFLSVRPLMDARVIVKKRLFLITDRNVINYESDSSYKKLSFTDLDAVKIIDKGNGTADILFGSDAIKRPYRKIRSTVLIARETTVNGEIRTTGTAFYNVKGSEKIRPLLPAAIKVTEEKLQ